MENKEEIEKIIKELKKELEEELILGFAIMKAKYLKLNPKVALEYSDFGNRVRKLLNKIKKYNEKM